MRSDSGASAQSNTGGNNSDDEEECGPRYVAMSEAEILQIPETIRFPIVQNAGLGIIPSPTTLSTTPSSSSSSSSSSSKTSTHVHAQKANQANAKVRVGRSGGGTGGLCSCSSCCNLRAPQHIDARPLGHMLSFLPPSISLDGAGADVVTRGGIQGHGQPIINIDRDVVDLACLSTSTATNTVNVDILEMQALGVEGAISGIDLLSEQQPLSGLNMQALLCKYLHAVHCHATRSGTGRFRIRIRIGF